MKAQIISATEISVIQEIMLRVDEGVVGKVTKHIREMHQLLLDSEEKVRVLKEENFELVKLKWSKK